MKIVSLCNLYGAEVTFTKELQANPKYSIVPVVDLNDHMRKNAPIYKTVDKAVGAKVIPVSQSSVDTLLKDEAPDLVVVRSWTSFANVHIPGSLYWKIESLHRTTPEQPLTAIKPNTSASYFATQNKEEVPSYTDLMNIPVAWFPRGVCASWEKSLTKTVDIISCGTATHSPKIASFNMLVKPLVDIYSPKQLHIYISSGSLGWANKHIRPAYSLEDAPKVIGSAKIFVSPVTTRFDPGIFSQKSLQAMACGAMLITQHYTGVEDIVGPDGENVVYADSKEEVLDKVAYYLRHDSEREAIANRGYRFVHSEYNYSKIFERVLKEFGIV